MLCIRFLLWTLTFILSSVIAKGQSLPSNNILYEVNDGMSYWTDGLSKNGGLKNIENKLDERDNTSVISIMHFATFTKESSLVLPINAASGTLLFSETFDEAENATTGVDNTGGVSWTALTPGALATTDYFKVVGGLLEAKDPNSPAATWTTGTINTSGYNRIDFTMDMSEDGNMEACADCSGSGTICIDWVKLEYRIDGGTWQEVAEDNCVATMTEAPGSMIQIGDISGGTESYATTISSGIGNTIEWRISCVSWTATELWRFDNIQVTGSTGASNPEVELSVSSNSGTEADGTVITATATASSAVSGDQTIDLGVSGTGITSTDYTLSNTTITILDGQTTGTVTFTIQDDADAEGTETATLTISNPSSGLTLGTTTTQNVTITDNDGTPPTTFTSLPSTEQTPDNQQRGVMFDIVANNEVIINSFDHFLLSVGAVGYEIHYKSGSFVGSESTAGDWTLAGTASIDAGASGSNVSIPIPINVTIPAGQTYGFYLTFITTDGATQYTNGSSTQTSLGSDANIEIKGGVGKDYPFGTTINNRYTSVTVHYNTDGTSVQLPTATTADATNIMGTSADLGGEVVSSGGFSVTERGIVYAPTATNANPQIGGTGTIKAVNGTGVGVFNETVSGLIDGTQYSYAAYAINQLGTSYGTVKTFTTTVSVQDVNLSVSANAGTEVGMTAITVTATASQAVSGDQTVDLGVTGTGITSTDYTLSNTTISILNGQTTGTVTFTVQDDSDIEGTETATLTISNPSAGITLGSTTTKNIAITDNDFPTVELSVSANTGNEVDGTVVTVTATASAAVSGDKTVNLGVSGTGITSADYALSNSTITILNGQTIGTATFTIQSDTDNEIAETATITISNPSTGLTLGTNTTEDILITDEACSASGVYTRGTSELQVIATSPYWVFIVGNRSIRRQYIITAAELNEIGISGAGLITALDLNFVSANTSPVDGLVMKMGTTTQNFYTAGTTSSTGSYINGLTTVIGVGNIPNTATVGWQTFTLDNPFVWDGSSNLVIEFVTDTFNSSGTSSTIDLENTDNTMSLYSESSSTAGTAQTTGNSVANRPIMRFTLCGAPEVNLSVSANSGTEADGTVITVTATASGGVSGDQTVDLGVTGTGITGTDYTLNNTTITILSGQTTGTATFTVQDDSDIEGTETATLTISNPSAGLTLGSTTTQNVAITDDDFPSVELSVSANAGTEAGSTAITVTATASSAVSGDQTVDLGISGTGITGTDYVLSNSTITILNGATTGTVTFTIQDDSAIEGTETAILTISNPSAGVTLGSTTTQNIAITNDDFPTVDLSVSANTGTEAAGTVITVTATSSQAVSGDQTVDLGVGGTGITGTDYTLSGSTITILNGQTTGTVTFTVQDDADIEGTETAILTISNPSAGITLGSTTTQNIAITDDDFSSVDLSVSANSGTEAGTTVITVTVTASQAVTGDQTVNLGVSGTGITGTDYTLSGTTITILNGQTTGTVTFTIQDDSAIEGTETATLTISNPSAGLTLGSTTTQNVAITDNDFPTVDLSVSANTGTEAGTTVVTVTATSSQVVSGDQTVDLGVSGTGIANTDYALSNTTITILSGQTTGSVTFTVQDDSAIEGAETATLTISNPSGGVTLGSTTTQNIAITDNDFPTVDLSVSANAGTEAGTTVITVTATSSQAVTGDQTVNLGVTGTGITSTDYILSGMTITILNGQTTGTVTFTVQDDSDIEGTETATLTISNPSAGVTLGSTTTQNIAITDNDFPTVDLSVSANTGAEAGTTAITVTATSSQAVSGNQTVDLGVTGTGITGTDYTLSSITITILNGQTTGSVTFTIQDDSDIEGTETATLTISNPSAGVTLGSTTTQNVSITDNDSPTVDLSVSANTGAEAGTTAITVTATSSQAVSGNQTVDLGVTGTGITGTDYTLSSITITILNGQTTGSVTFTIQDDSDIEGTETATLTISNPSAGVTLGSTTTQNVSITDDDFPSVDLSVSANAGTEAAGTVITVTATASQAVSGDQTVDLGVSGTDITSSDYTLSGTTITILNGQTTGTVTFTVQDDSAIEGAETAILTISNPSAGVTLGSATAQNISITDDDFPSVDLSVSANTGTEAGTTAITVTATSSQAVSGDQTVDLGVSGTGITGTDYTLSGTTITILNGQITGTVTFIVQDDSAIEGTETATLTISNPSAGITLGSTTTQNISITDNDFPSIDLSVSANTSTEAAGTVITVTATASQTVTGDQTVDVGVTGTGITGTDYTLSGTTITILNGQTTGTITFTVQDDPDIEGTETATLTISNPSTGVTLGSTTTQNVSITDNDFPSVNLSVSANTGTEAAGTVITVTATASQAVSGDQTLDLSVTGSGITGTDYTLSGTTITIINGQTSGTVTFTIQDDSDIEGTETATLTISNPSTGVTLGSTTTQNVSITDNDSPTVDLSVSANTGTEAAGTVITVTATASQAVSGDQTVDLGVSGAGIMGTDYALSGSTITILNGQTTGSVTFAIQNDSDIEGTETVTLTISNPSSGVSLGSTTTQNVSITDNDFPTVDLSVSANTGAEAGTTAITVTATSSQAVSGNQTVDLGINGTGITSTDFILSATTITILNGQTTGTVTFTVQDDSTIEGTETATLTISNPSAGVTLGSTTTQNVSITDNDFPTVDLSVSANTGAEAGTTAITVTATSSQAVSGNQTVDLGVTGTGITGTDYTLSSITITILNGQTTGSVTFTVQDDADIEGTETATLTISNPSAGVTLGSTTTQNVSITDNDFPSIDLSVSANAGTESGTTIITVTATSSTAVTGDQTVDLGVSGTGISGTDYMLSNTTITILNGQTTGSVTFTVQDDSDIEGPETAVLTISNPSSGVVLGSTTNQNVVITDNDFAPNPIVSLSVTTNSGTEAAGTVITVTATASSAVTGDQTVDLGVNGTGINGTDYTLSGTTITILNGQTTGTVTFTVQDDTNIEGTETATLTIGNPSTGVTLGSTTTQNIAITDNDFPLVDLSVSANTGTEAAWTVITVTATSSQAVSGDQTIDLGVSGTGITGGDYTLSGTTITILNGQTSGTVTFIVQDDSDIEGPETAVLAINNPSSGILLGSITSQNIVITDNDFAANPIVSLGASTNSGTEAGATAITVTATASSAVSGDQTVDLGVSGTGISGTDYMLSNTTMTILNGQITGIVTFTIQDDNTIEGTETAILTISNPSSGITLGSTTTQNIAITDNDFPSVDLSVSANTGTEAAGTVITVTATASQAVTGDQTVDLGVSGTGITGADYTLSNTTITILDGQTSGTVTFIVQDDSDIEGTETATLTISNPSAGITLGSTTTQDIAITDNDFPSVDLSVSASAGTEAAGTVITVTATASQAVTGDQTVDLGVTGTGIAGTDYTLSSSTITILNGQTTGTVTFTIQDDLDIEGTETAALTISNPSSGLTLGSTTTQNIAITDDDFPSVDLNASANAGTEAGTTVITVTATSSQAVTGDQTVDLGVSGTGITGTDYTLSSTTMTILNGQTTGTVTFTVQDDSAIEGTEIATLTISNPSAGITLGSTTTQNIAITDNDFPSVDLSVSANTGTEAGTTVITVTATASSAVSGDQTVDLGVSGTGITSADYTLSSTTITILNGQTTGMVTFTVQDDSDIEGSETATLTIGNPSAGITLGSTTTQNITITDDDFPSVDLSVSASTGTEAAGTVITVTATASQAVTGDQTVNLVVTGAGIMGTDYALSNSTITILDGATTGTVTFTVQDDSDIEGTETATLTISNPSAGITLGSTTTQNIVITDNDFPSIDLSVSANTGTEAGATAITVTATASAAVSGDQTIDLGVSGTGITGTDYTLSNTTITILNGQTTGTVTFTVQDDSTIEGTETATLTISNPSAGITLGSTTTQNIVITDNDFPPVDLSVSANTGTEAAGTVITVTATASAAVTGDQTVDLGVSGSGITGTDYTLSSSTITILNGQTSGTVTFTIQDDSDIEGTETATLTISNPSAGITLGSTTTQNIAITDNDFPIVELSVNTNTGTEAATTAIIVTATAASTVVGDQSVDIGVSGTGITNTDYTLSTTTITILNGQTIGTATFTIQDDTDIEGNETAVLTLSNPTSGVVLGSMITQSIQIGDNDAADPTNVNTTITATPLSVMADGIATSTIEVQLSDAGGNLLTNSGGAVLLNTTGSAVLSAVTDNLDGSYTATITNTVSEVVTITGLLEGVLIRDNEEVTFTPNITDSDGDGIIDIEEDLNNNGNLDDDDTDGDGLPNYLDNDDDGDSIRTQDEDIDNNGNPDNDDTDGDGLPNYLDNDDDGDGIPTLEEDANNNLNLFDDDTDGDGIFNFLDSEENMNINKIFSPNGDGINDVLQIRDAEKYPNNRVSIFNRNGSLVFEITGYNNRDKGWTGVPNTGFFVNTDRIVPNGTYFYVIEPNDGSKTVTGFFILKR